jgi:hypothetical protein
MRHTKGHSFFGYRRNEDILELKLDPVENKSAQYEQKWLNRVRRMGDIKHPK